MDCNRLVVGAGMFGLEAALVLARRGHSVVVIEADDVPMSRASFVNQARVHTGLHYPRSLLTARDALRRYGDFRRRFGPAIHDFTHLYAVSEWGTKSDAEAVEAHARRLSLPVERVDPDRWFHTGTVAAAFVVEEPAFDASVVRALLLGEIARQPSISVRVGVSVEALESVGDGVVATLSTGQRVLTEGVVLAAYAGLNSLRAMLDLSPLPLKFELAEVVLGRFPPDLDGLGITMMDGQFWSFMPFGHSGSVSLTNVGLTPTATSEGEPRFPCQTRRSGCGPRRLAPCTTCGERPASLWRHQVQQMGRHFRRASEFRYERSLWTTKTILGATEVDDARPTLLRREGDLPVWSVLSGKVSTLFDLEELQ